MKRIENGVPVNGMLNPSLSNTSYVPILQGILDGIGWKSPSVVINEEQRSEVERRLSFQEIERLYEQDPDETHRQRLLAAIEAEIAAAKTDLRSAQRLQKEAHDALMKKTPASSMVSRLGNWLIKNAQYAFDSTPEQLIKRYSVIAKERKAQIKKLSRYRNKISLENLKVVNDDNAYYLSQNIAYPSSFNLSNLEKNMGFVTSVIEPYMVWYFGSSVTNVGDINGDAIDDFASAGSINNNHPIVCIIFGSKNIGNTSLDLNNMSHTTGFVFDAGVSSSNQIYVSNAGDINADGLDDLLVSLPHDSGRIYVIFGNYSIGMVGTLKFSDLKGGNGFLINGTGVSGSSIDYAGDINDDGVDDIVIGVAGIYANTYVVFGKKNVGSDGVMQLSDLNGTNGFILKGSQGMGSISMVSYAGDVNSDGITDLLIIGNGNSVGILLGKIGLGAKGIIPWSDLNGTNGFIVEGIPQSDYPCTRIANTGDINSDGIDDFVISNPCSFNTTGMTYVIFGRKNIGSDGIFQLSNLNGTNGFKLNGVNLGDFSGISISKAGDINNDGIDDLVISALMDNSNYSGVVYVVFGDYSVGSSSNGNISLSSLNGNNGFALNGNQWDQLGSSVSNAGDVNDDGIGDLLLGAPGVRVTSTNSGVAYVIFGGRSLYSASSPTQSRRNIIIISAATSAGLIALALLYYAYKYRKKSHKINLTDQKLLNLNQKQTWPESDEVVADTETLTLPTNETSSLISYHSLSTEPVVIPDCNFSQGSTQSTVISLSAIELKSPVRSKAPIIDESGEIKVSFGKKFAELKYNEKDKLGQGAYGTVYKENL